MQALLATVKNGKGLRIDGTIRHPTSCEDIWFDVSAIHTTGPTRIRAEVKLTRQRQAAGKDGARMQSAALLRTYNGKLDRYALLSALVERQVVDGLRDAAPRILPVVFSTHGELCPGALQLQEWLVDKYRLRLELEGERDDGRKVAELVAAADFRHNFHVSLLVAVVQGHADMLTTAGNIFRKGLARSSMLTALSQTDDADADADADSDSDF